MNGEHISLRKKIAFSGIFLTTLALLLSLFMACSYKGESRIGDYYEDDNDFMAVVEKHGVYQIVVDKETKVEYIKYVKGSGQSSTAALSVRLDKNGDPIIYEGDLN